MPPWDYREITIMLHLQQGNLPYRLQSFTVSQAEGGSGLHQGNDTMVVVTKAEMVMHGHDCTLQCTDCPSINLLMKANLQTPNVKSL